MNDQKGFTLIELMVVITIIGILAAIAIPQFNTYRLRAVVSEGVVLGGDMRKEVQAYVDHTGVLPETNDQAGLAAPETIRGKYVDGVTVENGLITVVFNDSYPGLAGTILRLTPEINTANPTGPLIWEKVTETREHGAGEEK